MMAWAGAVTWKQEKDSGVVTVPVLGTGGAVGWLIRIWGCSWQGCFVEEAESGEAGASRQALR